MAAGTEENKKHENRVGVLSCSKTASSCSRAASLSIRIFRMPARFAILISISRISLLAMFFLTPSISSSCIMPPFSFRSFWTECGASGVDGPSSSSFRPRDTRRRCFLAPASSNSGKLAWKPWKSEYELSSSGMFCRSSSGTYERARDWISLVESLDRTRSVGVVRAIENMLRCRLGRRSCLCTSLMAFW